jgi:hypothetical protein
MIGIIAFFILATVFVAGALLRKDLKRLRVSAALGNANFTLEADAGDASKAAPPGKVLEVWARAIATRNDGGSSVAPS